MCFPGRRAPEHSLKLFGLALLIAAVVAGCTGSNWKTPEEQLDDVFKNHPEFKRLQVAKFQGHVTIDGQPPEPGSHLHLILLNADRFQDPKAPRAQSKVLDSGDFSFSTYLKDDGAPVGKWVAVFVDPRQGGTGVSGHQIGGSAVAGAGFMRKIGGPDMLKNLYNDPEKNLKDPDFVIDLQAPGITDKTFNLRVVGKDSPPVPGRYAITKVTETIGNSTELKQ